MASDLLEMYGNKITELKLIPSGGGVFEIHKNNQLIFSKKKLERFPELEEIVGLISLVLYFGGISLLVWGNYEKS